MSSTALSSAPSSSDVNPVLTGLLLASLLFLPAALGYLYQASSFATGTAIISVLALVLVGLGQIPLTAYNAQIALAWAGAIGFLIMAHLVLAVIIAQDSEMDYERALLSLLLFSLIIFSVPALCGALLENSKGLRLIVFMVCGAFVLIALFSLAQIQPETESLGDKPTFPYTEPSFFGFSVPAILIFCLLRVPVVIRPVLVVLFVFLGYALGNFTIIAACLLAASTALPLSWLAAGGLAGLAGSASLDLSYYTERLNFDWANSSNLSALVYVQGWQMLEEALRTTQAWGRGFQQLGIGYTNVPASVRINALLGRDANLQDGGFILSKMGSEFGILGLAIAAFYFYIAVLSFLRLRKLSRKKIAMSDEELLARSCVIGYLIELVVRGTNYFTGTFVLLLVAIYFLAKERTRKSATQISS